jgi:hypothetical protein
MRKNKNASTALNIRESWGAQLHGQIAHDRRNNATLLKYASRCGSEISSNVDT